MFIVFNHQTKNVRAKFLKYIKVISAIMPSIRTLQQDHFLLFSLFHYLNPSNLV